MTPQEAWEARGNLYDKYNDPNWMLQAGLGDIEFEQDMYDDIRYGGISEEGAKFGDVLGFSEDPYDVTGLAGLREHATKGPTRYLDFTPFDLPSEKFDTDKFGYDIGEGGYEDYLGRYNVREDALGEGTGETTNIDINLPKHIGWWDRTGRGGGHALQNMISDTYRHEYKHSPKLTSHRNPYHHQAIYGQGAKYGLSPVSREQSFQKFMDPPAENFSTVHYNPSRAAETSRDISSFASNPFERSFEQPTNRAVSRQPARGPHGYQRGGSVNPHEETARAARDWSPREQYISRSNLPSYRAERSDNVPDYFKKPYTPSDNIPDPYPLGDNLGIMAAMTDTSPDFRGNWLFNNKFGNMFGNFMLGRHGDNISPEYKEILGEAFGQDGGFPLWGGKLSPIIEDDRWGLNWSIGG